MNARPARPRRHSFRFRSSGTNRELEEVIRLAVRLPPLHAPDHAIVPTSELDDPHRLYLDAKRYAYFARSGHKPQQCEVRLGDLVLRLEVVPFGLLLASE